MQTLSHLGSKQLHWFKFGNPIQVQIWKSGLTDAQSAMMIYLTSLSFMIWKMGSMGKARRIEELKMGLEIYLPRFCCWTRRQSKSNINGLLTLNKNKLSSKPITREKLKNEWLFWPAPKPLFWNGRIESFQKQTHYILKWTSYIESFFF